MGPSGLFTIAEVSAARSIRNTLAEIEIENGKQLIEDTAGDRIAELASFELISMLVLAMTHTDSIIWKEGKEKFGRDCLQRCEAIAKWQATRRSRLQYKPTFPKPSHLLKIAPFPILAPILQLTKRVDIEISAWRDHEVAGFA